MPDAEYLFHVETHPGAACMNWGYLVASEIAFPLIHCASPRGNLAAEARGSK